MSQCCWETENISGLKECHYFCCKNVPGSLASPSDICSSLFSANANSSSQERWNIPLRSQTHLSSGLLCSCQQLSHLGFITEPSPPARHFCCWQFCSKSHGANLRCSFPVALHISFPPSKVMWDKPHEKKTCFDTNPWHQMFYVKRLGWVLIPSCGNMIPPATSAAGMCGDEDGAKQQPWSPPGQDSLWFGIRQNYLPHSVFFNPCLT